MHVHNWKSFFLNVHKKHSIFWKFFKICENENDYFYAVHLKIENTIISKNVQKCKSMKLFANLEPVPTAKYI